MTKQFWVKVLGTPLGGDQFVRDALQATVGKMRQFCDRVISLDHTQASLALLRKCTGVCKVLHLFKTLPESYLDGLASEVDAVITDCCQRVVGFPFTETMMLQLSLPVRLGGLGIPSAQRLAPVASLVGGMAFWKFGLVRPAVPDTLLAPSAVWFPVSLLEKVCKYVPASCAIPRLWLANHQMPPETYLYKLYANSSP